MTAPGLGPLAATMIPTAQYGAMGAGAAGGGLFGGGLFGAMTKQDKIFLLAQALGQIGAGIASTPREQGGAVGGFSRGVAGATSGLLSTLSGMRELRMESSQRAFLARRMGETNDPREKSMLGAILAGVPASAAARMYREPRTGLITEGVPGQPDMRRQRVAELTPGATFEPYQSRAKGTGGVSANMARLDDQSRSMWGTFSSLPDEQRQAWLMGATPAQRDQLTRRWFNEPEDSYQGRLETALRAGAMTGGIPVQGPQGPQPAQGPGLISRMLEGIGFTGPATAETAEEPAESRSPEEVEAELRQRLGTPTPAPKAAAPMAPPAPEPEKATTTPSPPPFDPYAGITFHTKPPAPGPGQERRYLAGRGYFLVPQGWQVPRETGVAEGLINRFLRWRGMDPQGTYQQQR